LRCDHCSARWPAHEPILLCPDCNGMLDAEYDRDAMARDVSLDKILARRPGVWRWREMLPVADEKGFIAWIGARVFVKYEVQQPTGSLKDRSFAVAVAKAAELGVRGGFVGSYKKASSGESVGH
jgi:threonine synthase